MQILDASANLKSLGITNSVALGMFDGVHLGHREVISTAVKNAQSRKQRSAVITLASHPRKLTEGKAPSLITNLASRLYLFERLGLDYALVLDFDQNLREMEAKDFFKTFLLDKLNANFISVGYDHHFGKNRSGNPNLLHEWCKEANINCEIIPALELNGNTVSSSRIRTLIQEGQIEEANKLLGYDFLIIAEVIKGEGLGHQLGFPTANLNIDTSLVLPAKGVYSGYCEISHEKKSYQCVVNIGTRPSFTPEQKLNIEVHILNFKDNIYGKPLKLHFIKKLRNEFKFNSREELVQQINKDINNALTQA